MAMQDDATQGACDEEAQPLVRVEQRFPLWRFGPMSSEQWPPPQTKAAQAAQDVGFYRDVESVNRYLDAQEEKRSEESALAEVTQRALTAVTEYAKDVFSAGPFQDIVRPHRQRDAQRKKRAAEATAAQLQIPPAPAETVPALSCDDEVCLERAWGYFRRNAAAADKSKAADDAQHERDLERLRRFCVAWEERTAAGWKFRADAPTGLAPATEPASCAACQGRGWVVRDDRAPVVTAPCPECREPPEAKAFPGRVLAWGG